MLYVAAFLACLIAFLILVDKTAIFRGQRTGLTAGDGRKPVSPIIEAAVKIGFLCVVFILPCCTLLSPWLLLPFLLYLPSYIDGSEKYGCRSSDFLKKCSCWILFKYRMNLKFIKTSDFNPQQQYILAAHPHGIVPLGCILNLVSDLHHAAQSLNISFNFIAAREILLGAGIADATKKYAEDLLRNGRNIGIFPGGATEALYARPGENVVYIRRRRGFVRLALSSGAALVPVYTFGENDSFDQLPDYFACITQFKRLWQRVFGISLPLITNIIPRRCNVTTVVGAPLPARRAADPTAGPSDAEVEALMEEYVAALQRLFDDWHDRCLPERAGKGRLVIL